MNLQAIIFGLALILMSFVFAQCQTSQLPKEMPAGVEINYDIIGGMSRSYTKITVAENALIVEEVKGGQRDPIVRSVEITAEDKEKLYRVFFENKFDLIKNDERQGIVYDAGSERITISFGRQFYGVTSGQNSPLSGFSQKRYLAVSNAIRDLVNRLSPAE